MPFVRPSLTGIVERIRADFAAWLPGADSRLRGSVLDVLGRMVAGVANGLYSHQSFIARQILPDTAESEYLARHAAIRLPDGRKPAIAASGNATATGVNGSIIDAATILVRADGVRYRVETAVAIAAGSATLALAAEDGGDAGNCPVGQALVFANPVPGVNAQALVAAGGLIGGAAEESDAALLERLLLRMRNTPQGGAKTDYLQWALQVPEVTRAWVYPGWLGSGTVGVAFTMDGRVNPLPLPADVLAVQAHIDALRPVTAALTVFAPIARPLNIALSALPPTPEVQAAISAELADLLFRVAEPGGSVLLSHIREAISIAPGEYDHTLISPNANQHAEPGEMFVLGVVSYA